MTKNNKTMNDITAKIAAAITAILMIAFSYAPAYALSYSLNYLDNGDGTLTIEPTYKDAEGNEVKTADFTNTYQAEGETTLQVWKDLSGRDLEEGEFTFELLDENGDPILNEDGEAVTVTLQVSV